MYTQDETSHKRLREKCQLDFSLTADTERAMAKAYGTIAFGGLPFSAKARIGIADRVAFIIDKKRTRSAILSTSLTQATTQSGLDPAVNARSNIGGHCRPEVLGEALGYCICANFQP